MHNAHHFAPELALAVFRLRASTPALNGGRDRIGENLYLDVLQYDWKHTSDPMQMGRDAGVYDALRIYPRTLVKVMKDMTKAAKTV
jgi:hypothetical protein